MKRLHWAATWVVILLLVSSAMRAQEVLLRDVRIVDGTGVPAVEHGYLLLHGDKIASVGQTVPASLPAATLVLDEKGKTVLPGLIADHVHVGMVHGASAGNENYTEANVLSALRQYERYGVTTVAALGLNGELFYALRAQLHVGQLAGSDLFGAGQGIGIAQGAPPMDLGADRLYRVATPEQARAAVRAMAARHVDLIKIWVDDFHGTLPVKMSPAISSAAIDEAHKNGLRVAAHVFYLSDAKELIAEGADILAHGVRDRAVDSALIASLKSHGTWYIPTLDLDESSFIYAEHPDWMKTEFFTASLSPALRAEFADPAWRAKSLNDASSVSVSKAALAMNERNLKTLSDAGVRIGFGTDSGATPLRIPGFAEHRELALMVASGLTPLQTIHVATEEGAALLGLEDRGVLAPGKLADFVIVDGKPDERIEDLDRITAVYHRGRPVDLQEQPDAVREAYVPVAKAAEPGHAPGMRVQQLSASGAAVQEYAVIFAKGDEVASGLLQFAQQYQIHSAHFTAIGALHDVTVGWMDQSRKAYKAISIPEQVEVLTMAGDITEYHGKSAVHAHLAVATSDGKARGGHLLEAHVYPTLEVMVTVDTVPMHREFDEETGLGLITPTTGVDEGNRGNK